MSLKSQRRKSIGEEIVSTPHVYGCVSKPEDTRSSEKPSTSSGNKEEAQPKSAIGEAEIREEPINRWFPSKSMSLILTNESTLQERLQQSTIDLNLQLSYAREAPPSLLIQISLKMRRPLPRGRNRTWRLRSRVDWADEEKKHRSGAKPGHPGEKPAKTVLSELPLPRDKAGVGYYGNHRYAES